MRFAALAPLAFALIACGTGPAGPAIWTVNDLDDALVRNLASISEEMEGEWVPAGAGCDGLTLSLDMAEARPDVIPDVAGWFTALSGATLALAPAQPDPGRQAYVLSTAAGDQGLVRDLATNGIVWQMPDRGSLRIFPGYLSLDGPALDLLIDEDTVSVQVGTAPPIAFERC